ncbi:agmatinase [Verrucomicrobia bacterium]|nr:agmatinase [Verrucomicrobiota bacterium]
MSTLNFHADDVPATAPEDALFHIIPVPFEDSVSYGTGTGAGPLAILEASAQLELFTGKNIPADQGIYTAPAIDCSAGCAATLTNIEHEVTNTLTHNKLPVLLGGEHTLSYGAATALKKHYGEFGIIQFDAHADLRDNYEGSSYSHACVMRRIHELGIPVYQLGTRSYALEEHEYRKCHAIGYRDSEDIWKQGTGLELPSDFPEKVFISFDIDALDGAIIPSTGTPVPGGLNWYQATWLLEAAIDKRICIGFDVVELAPIKGLHGPDFATAQLIYNIMGMIVASEKNRKFWEID